MCALISAAAPAHAIEPSLGVAVEGNYGRAVSPVPESGLRDFGAFALRARGVVGDPVGYGFGLDLSLGGATGGFAYDATADPLGFAAAFAGGDFVGVFAGAGVDGVVGVLSPAARFPLELHIELQGGPLRFTLSAAPAWVAARVRWRSGCGNGRWSVIASSALRSGSVSTAANDARTALARRSAPVACSGRARNRAMTRHHVPRPRLPR